MTTTLQKTELKVLTDAVFFYVASSKDGGFELPESIEESQLSEFAERLIEHISTKFEIDRDEVNEKTERMINDFLSGR